MRSWLRNLFAVLSLLAMSVPNISLATEKIGVLLMHGKKSTPENVLSLAQELKNAGYLVETPEMPWSRKRAYDRTLEESHIEIDTWVDRLKTQGATQIVIAGHSMGANMAMGYAATHPGMAAVIAIGPGQTVDSANFRDALGGSVSLAKRLVADGRGEEEALFSDLHLGKVSPVTTRARVYVSYFDPEGLANMPNAASRIVVPFLWLVGTEDKNLMEKGKGYVFDLIPANPLNRYIEVFANHMGTPQASSIAILYWLGTVFRQKAGDDPSPPATGPERQSSR